jgi:flagellar motility protein MotE (MotC chaperone)
VSRIADRLLQRLRLLPVLILVAMLAFTVRIGDFWAEVHRAGSAAAQEEVKAEPPPMPSPEDAAKTDAPPLPSLPDMSGAEKQAAIDAQKPQAVSDAPAAPPLPGAPETPDAAKGLPAAPAAADAKPVDWKDASDSDIAESDSQMKLYQDLSKRRQALDSREKTLNQREALLKAGEHELDQKLNELTTLKGEIQGLLQTQSDEEKARMGSLVKIYEGMKPQDAARIFNTLEMDVLLRVMTQMSERKTAPILAQMDPDRARNITVMMAQQKQLPSVPAE